MGPKSGLKPVESGGGTPCVSQPLLSVCIPTFNRAPYLREALGSLFTALKGHELVVEVFISDNASTDETPELLSRLKSENVQIRFLRNEVSLGAEGNLWRCAELARGDYIWFLGDDDKISPDFLAVVLGRLGEKPEMVVCNYSVHGKDFSFVYNEHFFSPRLPEKFHTRDAVLRAFGPGVGFLGSVVLKRKMFLGVSRSDYNYYASYGFSFMFAVYAGISERTAICFVKEPLVYCRGGNSGGFDWERYFIDGVAKALEGLQVLGYSSGSVRKARNDVIRYYIRQYAVGLKIRNKFTVELLKRIHQYYAGCSMFWTQIIPVFLLPGFVLRYLKVLLRRRLT